MAINVPRNVMFTKSGTKLVQELVPKYGVWTSQIADGVEAQTVILDGLDRLRENLQLRQKNGAPS